MKKFVRIHSNMNIMVNAGLLFKDLTDEKANVTDKLKVGADWPKTRVLIKVGSHLYPSEIAEWDSVKSLVKDKVLTIGEYLDEPEDSNDDVAAQKEKLTIALDEIEKTKKPKSRRVKDFSLEEATKE